MEQYCNVFTTHCMVEIRMEVHDRNFGNLEPFSLQSVQSFHMGLFFCWKIKTCKGHFAICRILYSIINSRCFWIWHVKFVFTWLRYLPHIFYDNFLIYSFLPFLYDFIFCGLSLSYDLSCWFLLILCGFHL
jgi:hypothetical protein